MDSFLYAITIPSSKEVVYFREFTNKHFKAFIKTLLNNDHTLCRMFIDSLITDLAYTPIQVSRLSIIDKLVIMLTIRAYNISPNVQLQTKLKDSDDKINFDIDVNEILNTVRQFEVDNTFQVRDATGLIVNGTLPGDLYCNSVFDVVSSCIHTIELPTEGSNRVIDVSILDSKERAYIISKLTSDVFAQIYSYLTQQDKKFDQVPLIQLDIDADTALSDTKINLSVLNKSAAEVIKLVYEVGLREFYTTEYTLMRRFKFSTEVINNSTPAEIGLYHNIIAEDLKREKEDMEKEQNQPQGQTITPAGR